MATVNSTPVQKNRPAVKVDPLVVRRSNYQDNNGNSKDTIVVHKVGQDQNFKAYAYNAGADKVKQLFRTDKDGDSILMELLKFAIEKGLSMKDAEASVNLLASQFVGYKDAVAEQNHQHGDDEDFQSA